MQNKDSGLYRGKRHKDGGIPVIVDGNTPVEVEGGEYKICRDAYYSNDILSFKNKTNKEILDYIHNEFGCKFEQNKAQSGDFILCRLVVGNDERKDRQGTVEQILNEMQDEVGCKIENADRIKKEGGEVNNEYKLTKYILSAETENDSKELYSGYDYNRAKSEFDSVDINDYDGEHGFTAVLGKVVYDYQFVGSLDEDESIDDYPFTVFYDDEDYYKLQSQSDFEEIDTKVVENVNKASDSLLNDVEHYYASKYNKGYSAKYINIQVTNGLDYYDENHIEYGCVQLRFADHSWNAANNDRFGNCDYYISIVIANKNKTKERFGVSMFELKNNEVELTFNSDDDFDFIVSKIDRQIDEAKEYVIEKYSGNNPDIKYGHGGGVKTDFNDYENDDFKKAMLSLWSDFTNGRISNYLDIENENYVLNDQDGLMVIFRNKDLGDFTKVEREYIGNWFNTYLDANKKPFISKYIDTFYVEANRIIIKLKPQIMYAKGGTLLLAPNGKPSNLTPEQYKLVRTPEFKAWFGDWENDPENASKVIDENGEPLVVYRGFNKKSDAGFVFKYKVNRFKHNRKANRFAHYFTRSKNVALEYAEQGEKIDDEDVIVKSYFLKCDKMLNLTKENPLYPTYEEWIKTRHNVFLYSPHDIVEKLKKRSIPIHSYLFDSVLSKAKNENDINELSELKINELVKQIKKEEKEELKRYESSEDVNFFHLFKLITGKEASQNIANDIDEYKAEARRDVYNYFINYKPSDSIIMPDLDLFLKDLIIENNFNGGKFNEWQFGVKKQTDKEVYFVFESNQIKLADGTNTTFDSNNPDIRFEKGGRTIAQTPAPKKDRVYGSDVNKPESAKDIESAESISFDDKTLHTISNKIETHNKKYPNKHIDLATAKAVVRRGMGAYSKSHRPTISGGMPNDRTAWGLARLNAFIYKVEHGSSKSGKYIQDDDLLDELGIKHKNYAEGGLIAPNGKPSNLTPEQYKLVRTSEFKAWFGDWENDPENSSKVIDENGEPLVVYHFTEKKFNVFELKGISDGFFFTPIKNDEEFYYEGNKSKSFFLSIKRLAELRDMPKNHWSIPFYENEWISTSKSDGGDGIQFVREDDNKKIIVAFYPEQIKLADGTNTTFDGSNPDIRYKKGGLLTNQEKKETYAKWSKLINMSASELKRFYDSDEGKVAGLTKKEAEEQGIHSGRESARWIMKMKHTPYTQWTPTMWEWANRQISFVSRMSGMKGELFKDGKPTRKLLALKIWGNDPERYESGGQLGEKGFLRFTDKVEMPFTYKLIEAKDLIPSHLPSGERNPLHTIAEGQPKERNDVSSRLAQDEIAESPRFKELTESTNAYFGAPVVNKQGEVIQGNNRSIGLKKHYSIHGTSYKKDLTENSERFGFTKEQVESMNEPILVREVPADFKLSIELGNYDVKDLETGGKQRIDPLVISRKISPKDKIRLSDIVFTDAYKTTKEAIRDNISEIGSIIKQYINSAQYATLFSKQGELTTKGIDDIDGIINHFLFDGGDVILPDIFVDLPATIQTGLQKSLKYIYNVPESKSILPEIQEAMKILDEYQSSDVDDFREWENQIEMFTMKSPIQRFKPETLKLAKLLKDAKKQSDIINYMKEYSNLVSDKPADMFSPEIKGMDKDKAFSIVFGTEIKKDKKEKMNLSIVQPDEPMFDLSNYKNPYEVNRAIEKFLDTKGDDRADYTPSEIEFISNYSGYGGLEKKGTFSQEELKGLLYEYFTPDEVVKKMWGLAYKYGYGSLSNQGVFEPSCGIGAFLKYAPENVPVVGNEINKYSAMIAKVLYPNAAIKLQYFEQNFIKNNDTIKAKIDKLEKYGLVIGNPPYGDLGGKYQGMGEKDYSKATNFIEYFIFRGLDLLIPNGLLIYIVGAEQKNGGTLFLDGKNKAIKNAIHNKAELLDAYRLPINIFERTGVSSEILVFKKR